MRRCPCGSLHPEFLPAHFDPRILHQRNPSAAMIEDEPDLAIDATGTQPASDFADAAVAMLAEQAE